MSTTTRLLLQLGDLMPDYREPGYLRRMARMIGGLQRPRSSREYKEAVIEAQRLSAPAAALLLPVLAVALLTILSNRQTDQDSIYTVHYLPVEDTLILTEPPNDIARTCDPTAPADVTFALDTPNVDLGAGTSLSDQRVSQSPVADLNTVRNIHSGVILPGILGANRGAEARGGLIAKYDGDQMTEDAVMRALRWLKKNQQPDGSWKSQKVAMTGLALLSFLAHGEVPDNGKSTEFGETVHRALEYLLSNQKADGRFNGADGHEYAHPIAAYALCEAYGMTLNPNVKTAAEKALVPIISGQHPTGGWNYKMDPGLDKETGTYRDDTSYMGWCVQAVKAAQLAKLKVEGLEKAGKLAVRGFKSNANPNGGFGYTGPGQGGLTSVGTLSLQLLGAGGETVVRRSIDLMDRWQPSFEASNPTGNSLQYYCYYATQSKFHSGGKRWENWNKMMKPLYVSSQLVEKGAVKDCNGNSADIGWWVNGDAHTDRPVMDTCLAALQLMVYYRNLPTTTKAAVEAPSAVFAAVTDPEDIPVSLPKNL